MVPGVHYDPCKSSTKITFYSTQCIFYADAALNDLEIEEWDVLGAYL